MICCHDCNVSLEDLDTFFYEDKSYCEICSPWKKSKTDIKNIYYSYNSSLQKSINIHINNFKKKRKIL